MGTRLRKPDYVVRSEDALPDTILCGQCGVEKAVTDMLLHRYRDGRIRVRTCLSCTADNKKLSRYKHKSTVEGVVKFLVLSAQSRCKRSNSAFDLAMDYMLAMWEQQNGACAISHLPFDLSPASGVRNRSPRAPSLDRINPNAGYTKGNVRLVALAVNLGLSNWGTDAVLPIWRAAVEHAHSS